MSNRHSKRKKEQPHPAQRANTNTHAPVATSTRVADATAAHGGARGFSAKFLRLLESGQGGGIAAVFGIAQILIAEQFGGLAVGGIVLFVADKTRTDSSAGHSGVGFALFALAICLLLAVWTLDAIWRPRIKVGRLGKFDWAPEFTYCSTHPSYVLIDLLMLPLWLPELANHPTGLSFNPLVAGACAFFVGIAVARLVCWYVFNRRISPDESRRAWQPVAMFVGIVALFLASIGIVDWIRSRH